MRVWKCGGVGMDKGDVPGGPLGRGRLTPRHCQEKEVFDTTGPGSLVCPTENQSLQTTSVYLKRSLLRVSDALQYRF